MKDSWLAIPGHVLRPARPRLALCLREREAHLAARRRVAEERADARARCEDRIHGARAEIFAANDGVVPYRMRELEREWLTLSRADAEGGLMDLWARIAPPSWIDRKRWRDGDPSSLLDAAIALASDAEGVEAVESSIAALRTALAPWGVVLGRRVHWRAFSRDADVAGALLAEPLRAAREGRRERGRRSQAIARARELERAVHEVAGARLPDRPLLARSLAVAAFVDAVWCSAPPVDVANPAAPLRDLFRAGYGLSAADEGGVVVELPPISP